MRDLGERNLMRKLIGSCIALAMLVASVGVASASTRAGSTPGVTKDEVKIGVTYIDFSELRDIVDIDHGDYEAAYNAVIDDLNKKGGINGRKVVPVFAPVNPVGTVPSQEACIKLTEDEQVFAAVGFFNQDAPLCYLEQHDTPVVGGNMTEEYLARAKAPWFSAESGDGTVEKVVQAFIEDGAFKNKKVGVVTAVQEQGLLDDTVLPILKKNKIKNASAIIDVAADDVTAGEQQAGVIAERFREDGVDTVLVVGNAIQLFATALGKTDYRPQLLATNQNTYLGYLGNPGHDKGVLEDSITGGVAVEFDEPGYAKCRKVVEKATGEKIKDPVDLEDGETETSVSASNACYNIGLFAAIAKAAGKDLTVQSFGKAGESMKSVDIPGFGTVTYDPATRSYSQPIYINRYDSAQDDVVQDPEPLA
jgi:ABC-type branched-subunit amino acid transport system substrate-binding protein